MSVLQVSGQRDTLISYSLDSVLISAGRLETPYMSLPASATTVDLRKSINFISHTDLSEAVKDVPGLFTLNGQNYAQDLRISLRGFGARSAFGIRGIKLVVDGIPETTPDGQGQLDNISVSDIALIEVLHGTSGAQYGNAAGGVIEISTLDIPPNNASTASIRVGSYGLQQYRLGTAQHLGKSILQISGNHHRSSGYRNQSGLVQTNILTRLTHQWGTSNLVWQASYLNSPKAEDPGGINLADATANTESARDRNISFNAGEEITHWKSSLSFKSNFSNTLSLVTNAFYSGRAFDGRLPFSNGGAIDLDRKYGGVMSQLNYLNTGTHSVHKMSIGIEVLSQRDNRDRYVNNDGTRGVLTLSQLEKFDNFGFYFIDQWSNNLWTVRGSLRYDDNKIGVDDNFLIDGDDSGDRKLSNFNYSAAVNYRISDRNAAFINYSTSFETPALSELSSNPDGGGGFNNLLEPMKARTIEVGARGGSNEEIRYSISLFRIRSEDELIPFELNDFPGRTFFRNAGSTKRTGVEAGLTYAGIKKIELQSSYAYSNFKFDEYNVDGQDLANNPIPGIPQHALSTSLSYLSNRLTFKLSSQYFSRITVKDAGDVSVDPYHIVNFRAGTELQSGRVVYTPFVAINNLFSTAYFDNLRLNAFGGRFYEPAATINWQMGLSVVF